MQNLVKMLFGTLTLRNLQCFPSALSPQYCPPPIPPPGWLPRYT